MALGVVPSDPDSAAKTFANLKAMVDNMISFFYPGSPPSEHTLPRC
jgi:hypothetical protein